MSTRTALSPPRGGFTLIEILLALSLIALMVGMAIVNFGVLRGGQALEEGTSRLETALRMARADAANRGLRVRLAFGEADGQFLLLWEPLPLAEPGKFVEFTACTWDDYLVVEGVRVTRCGLTGPSIHRPADWAAAEASASGASETSAVTFEPDGSSDSAVIELAATDARDYRTAVITLDGLTGTITSQILTEVEQQELGRSQ